MMFACARSCRKPRQTPHEPPPCLCAPKAPSRVATTVPDTVMHDMSEGLHHSALSWSGTAQCYRLTDTILRQHTVAMGAGRPSPIRDLALAGSPVQERAMQSAAQLLTVRGKLRSRPNLLPSQQRRRVASSAEPCVDRGTLPHLHMRSRRQTQMRPRTSSGSAGPRVRRAPQLHLACSSPKATDRTRGWTAQAPRHRPRPVATAARDSAWDLSSCACCPGPWRTCPSKRWDAELASRWLL